MLLYSTLLNRARDRARKNHDSTTDPALDDPNDGGDPNGDNASGDDANGDDANNEGAEGEDKGAAKLPRLTGSTIRWRRSPLARSRWCW